jgi:hypothetical protein
MAYINGRVFIGLRSCDMKNIAYPLFLCFLDKGADKFRYERLPALLKSMEGGTKTAFNEKNNRYYMFTNGVVNIQQKSNVTNFVYRLYVTIINTESGQVISSAPFEYPMLNTFARTKADMKEGYTGLFSKATVHADNTLSVILEDPRHGSYLGKSNDLGILRLDENGKEQGAYMLRRSAEAYASYAKGSTKPTFFSFSFLPTPSGEAVVFNDMPENMNNSLSDDSKRMSGVSHADAILNQYDGKDVVRSYLFGKPDDRFSSRFAMIGDGEWSSGLQRYAVIMVDRNGREKEARLALVQF